MEDERTHSQMPLFPETDTIIREVERLSGRAVHVQEDPALQVLATVKTARDGAPAHFVRYQPGSQAVNYLIAYQLGFLVRLFSCAPDRRFQVGASSDEKNLANERLGLQTFEEAFASSLVDSIITQLLTVPVGMRVDRRLRSEFPSLIPEQEVAARSQLALHEKALAPEIRSRFPKALVDANTAMNAAFAAFWARELGERRYRLPYSVLGYDSIADELIEAVDHSPDEPEKDRELICRWADLTKLSGLFHFNLHQLD